MSATRTAQMNVASLGYVWDTDTLDWVAETQPGGTTGGAGDASAANQTTEIARLTSILAQLDVALSTRAAESGGNLATIAGKDFATQTTLALVKTALDTLHADLVAQAKLTDTQPVSLAAAPTTPVTNANLDAALSTLATAAKQPTLVSGRTPVDPSGVTSPVSLASLPALVAGSAVIGHVVVDTAPTTAVTGPLTDTQLRASAVPVSQATAANLNMTEASAASIKTNTDKIPSQGQALAAGSVPVVLTAIQQAALTPPAAISGFALEAGNLAAILAKIIAAPATEAKQDTGNTSLATVAAAIKAEDTASADLDPGIAALSVRTDVPNAPPTSLNGDYQFLASDSQGKLWVNTDVLAEIGKRANDLHLARTRLAADHLRFQSMMSGAFIPIPEVF